MTKPIPLVDLPAQHSEIAEEVQEGWARIVESGSFVLGEEVARFEEEFARFSGANHCVGVGNGTDALEFALRSIEIGPGDDVVVPTNSFAATAAAVTRTGARPLFADVDPETLLLDAADAKERITGSARAIIPVHLFGQMAPMPAILALASSAGLVVVEDAAQAHGATQQGANPGTFGAAAATSFYPGKNLGAYGDAGAVLTSDDHLAAKIRAIRNYGGERKHEHHVSGFNSRLDPLQAVVLRAKLRLLADWNDRRRSAAALYDSLLEDLGDVVRPSKAAGNLHVWHLYVVRVPDRDLVLARLNEAGIAAGIHYPTPIHLLPAFRHLGHKAGDFPVSEVASREILSLPLHPHITQSQQERVVTELRRALS